MTTGWQPAQAYPDPAIVTLDPRFEPLRPPMNAAVERLYTGCRWSEGPVWVGDLRCLLWSDIPNNRILKWDEETGEVSIFRKPSNSPNDVVVKSDGSVWFTDPTFGIGSNYEGHRAEPELPTNVYRVDGRTGRATIVAEGLSGPNGLCFSPDEQRLYIVESRAKPRAIRLFDVVGDGTKLANPRNFADLGDGTPDGFRCDVQGNLWCGWGMSEALNGVAVFAPDGMMIGRISLPERCANLCFGGLKRNRLFMAASPSLYAVYVNTEGAIGG